ncbi:MAG: hypothetical protein K2Y56_00975 [Methylobacterium sp.]|uniref:hypothetical protein n=1 Tax=Methylobacterium sp. TaxID=409 RepID=UPI0025F97494|nr:hypothetical protein [Methylobacterium sp.]MBX9930111.1 hypothetical protein [Methylobacterium sp.]
MRFTTSIVAALVLAAAPALAQSPSGNVGQPERAVPQAGNTTSGPIDNPSTRGMSPNPGPTMGPAGTGSVESAKGGNADQNNKPVGNTGNTSGGPAR